MLAAAFAAALAVTAVDGPAGPASCQWDGEVAPASTTDGHRLRVVFVDTDGQVSLRLGEDIISDRMLQTVQDGTGYAGALQCRLAGRQWLTVSAFDQETSVLLHMDEPNLVVVRAGSGSIHIDVDQTAEPPLLD